MASNKQDSKDNTTLDTLTKKLQSVETSMITLTGFTIKQAKFSYSNAVLIMLAIVVVQTAAKLAIKYIKYTPRLASWRSGHIGSTILAYSRFLIKSTIIGGLGYLYYKLRV